MDEQSQSTAPAIATEPETLPPVVSAPPPPSPSVVSAPPPPAETGPAEPIMHYEYSDPDGPQHSGPPTDIIGPPKMVADIRKGFRSGPGRVRFACNPNGVHSYWHRGTGSTSKNAHGFVVTCPQCLLSARFLADRALSGEDTESGPGPMVDITGKPCCG